jgi:hypothetical protein
MTNDKNQVKEAWVRPEIRSLDVSETRRDGGSGGDGGTYAPDCTRS